MLEEENLTVNSSVTPTDTPEQVEQTVQENPVENDSQKQAPKEKLTFSDAQKEWFTNKLREKLKHRNENFFKRYGVKDLDELDGLFNKSRQFDEISQKVEQLTSENATLSEQLAFIRNNVNPDKYDDIRRYFKGGNIQFNEGALLEALPTHPEWIKVAPIETAPKTTIQTLSPNRGHSIEESEAEKMNRIFGKI